MNETDFVGRKRELENLHLLLERQLAALVVIRGRRRIGKSRLVEEFAKGKRFLRFEGIAPTRKTTARMQRVEFARQMHRQLGFSPDQDLEDWGNLFTTLAERCLEGEVIILFDEITWMGSKDPVFLGKLKIVWDQYFQKNPKLILILCGSLSSWIEKNIISSTGFLGRISLKLSLTELPLSECHQLLRCRNFKGSMHEELMALAVTGGVPWYLEQINTSLPIAENIRRLCFEPNGLLVEEFKHIFHDLFGKRLPICKKIVEALIDNKREYEEIAKVINYPSGGPLSEYLDDLIISGFLERDHSWSIQTGEENKLSKFRIKDNYVRYYLKFIYPHLRKIKKGLFSNISPFQLSGFEGILGLQFENLVLNNRSEIWKMLALQPEDIVNENPYFQTKTILREGCQIDYLIQTRYHTLYLCEIKFSLRAIGQSAIAEVKKKQTALKIPHGFAVIPVLIHAGKVSKHVEESRFFAKIIDFTKVLTI